jgi:hypothetical protein
MLSKLTDVFNKTAVSIYKLIGFVVLTGIMLGITAYLGTSVFYLIDRAWVVPIVLSPSSEKVLQMNSHLIRQKYEAESLEIERMTFEAQLKNIDRSVETIELLLTSYERALEVNLEARQIELAALRQLHQQYSDAQPALAETSALMAEMAERNVEQELAAGLISEEGYLRGRSLVSSNLASSVGYAQRGVEFETQLAALERAVQALSATLDALRAGESNAADAALSMDVLNTMRDYNRQKLELAELEAQRPPLERSIAAIDESRADYAEIMDTIRRSPYYQALHEQATVAFVPYENLHNVEAGTPIYGCSLQLVWCHEVGEVVAVLDGEIQTRHPLFKTDMRGMMVQLELSEEKWAEEKALYAEGAPFFL